MYDPSWQVTNVYILQLERQVQDILGLLENAQGFRQVTNAQRGIAARKVVHQVVHSLQRLGSAFWGVLPGDEHATAAGHVLQAVLQSVIGKHLSQPAARHVLHPVLQSVIGKHLT